MTFYPLSDEPRDLESGPAPTMPPESPCDDITGADFADWMVDSFVRDRNRKSARAWYYRAR